MSFYLQYQEIFASGETYISDCVAFSLVFAYSDQQMIKRGKQLLTDLSKCLHRSGNAYSGKQMLAEISKCLQRLGKLPNAQPP